VRSGQQFPDTVLSFYSVDVVDIGDFELHRFAESETLSLDGEL